MKASLPIALALLLALTPAPLAGSWGDGGASAVDLGPLNGKQGANLKNALGAVSRPKVLDCVSMLNIYMEVQAETGMTPPEPTGVWNPFTRQWCVNENPMYKPEDVGPAVIVPFEWWEDDYRSLHAWGDTLTLDLINRLPGDVDVEKKRKLWSLGEVTDAYFDNGVWQSGTMEFGGFIVNVWTPPDDLRGDVARIFMYMSTLYPAQIWTEGAWVNYEAGAWPGLSAYSQRLLMEWHRADPPSDYELALDRHIRAVQGNGNPFVVMPVLAEYLWGYLADEMFEPMPEEAPLRGTYSLADSRIWLRSPHVPDGASWSVDGRPVADDKAWLSPSALGVGLHELKYNAAGVSGKVTIEIKP